MRTSPTHDASATEMGLILGTAHYMAPEQAMGKPIDKRVDVWAFGVVLFEMLTGRRAFDGEDVSGIVAAVLKDTPSWAVLPSETPSSIRRLLHRCLEKDRRERLGDMSAVRLDIKDALAGEPTSAGARRSQCTRNRAAAGLGGRASGDNGALRSACHLLLPQAARTARDAPPDQLAVDDRGVFVCALARCTAPRVRSGRCRREPAVGATA